MPDIKPPTVDTPPVPGIELKSDPSAVADTGSALDALFKESVPDTDKAAADEVAAAEKAAAEKAAADKAAADKAEAEKAAAAAAPPATPAPGAKPTETPPAPVKDDFDKIELPPHTKPAVNQSFDALKKASRERVAAVEKEREELRTKLAELEGRPAVDPKIEQELKELREFRQKLDVEADPTFKEYVEEIKTNDESIFSKLKEVGASEEVLTKMRTIGTKDLDWDSILEKLPPVARRYVENKLAVNEDLAEQRSRAVDEAKKNASEFLAEREKKNTQSELAHYAAAETHFGKVSTQLPWFKVQKAEATATPEEKAAIEEENKFFLKTQSAVKEMLADPSPEMRAIATLGYAQMLRLQAEIPAIVAEHTAEKKALADEVATLKAQLKEKEDFIARVKSSSRTSLRESSAPSNPNSVASQPTIGEHGSTALDRLRNEQLAAS
jgi:hypothetical protein